MAVFSGYINLEGISLKKTFVGTTFLPFNKPDIISITNNNGYFEFNLPPQFNLLNTGVSNLDIYIFCHNTVIKIFEYDSISDKPVVIKRNIANGGIVNITQSNETVYFEYFQMLVECQSVYKKVWRQFRPYNSTNRIDFPLPQTGTPSQIFASSKFIELTYPDGLALAKESFTQPLSLTTSYPFLHIKSTKRNTTIPHELGHAFHFLLFGFVMRDYIQTTYLNWLVLRIITLRKPYHGVKLQTSDFIAYIEAIGIFSERFYLYAIHHASQLSGNNLITSFINNELGPQNLSSTIAGYTDVGKLDNSNNLISSLPKGTDVEGRVYGALFLHLAKLIGLKEVVNFVLSSKATDVHEFHDYVLIHGTQAQIDALDEVEKAWFS